MILDFICELERILGKWSAATAKTLAQIADETNAAVPQVVDYLSDALDRELEVHEALTHADAVQALGVLKDRMSTQLAARERRMGERREKAIRAYDITMEKVRVLQAAKNWRAAYKTMSYYAGRHEKDVSDELMLSLCGECLRLGIKAESNLQELSLWLRKGVASCLAATTPEAIEGAVDFIDAYGDHFIEDPTLGGRRLLGSVLESIKVQAEAMSLAPQFDRLVKELRF